MTNPYKQPEKKILKLANYPVVFYQDSTNDWRWNIKAGNHKTIGASSEGFESKQMALNNFRLLAEAIHAYYDREKDTNS